MNKQNRADVTCRDTGTDSSFLPGQITPLSARRMGLGRRGGREKNSKCGQGGKKIPSGEAGRRERRSEEAVFGTSLFIPHALDCQGWG